MFQPKRIDLIDSSKPSSYANNLNIKEIALNQSLDNYKKVLQTIVKKMNRTPSNERLSKGKKSADRANPQSYHVSLLQSSMSGKFSVNQSFATEAAQTKQKTNESAEKALKRKEGITSIYETFLRSDSLGKLKKTNSTNKISGRVDHFDDKENINVNLLKTGSKAKLNVTVFQEHDLNIPEMENDSKIKELVHKYQLRDAIHRQEIAKLKKSNEALKNQVKSLQEELERVNKNRELESKYLARLESEINQLKDKDKIKTINLDKKVNTPKDNMKYIKIIEELNKKISNITAEKKLVEDLLKNALLQNEINKKKEKQQQQTQTRQVLASLDLNVLKNSQRNTPTANQSFIIKASNDRESTKTTQTSHRNSVGSPTIAISLLPDKDDEMGKATDTSILNTSQQQLKFQQQLNSAVEVEEIPEMDEESDRFLSNRVHPPRPTVSLKDKFDMTQLRLDLSQILKNRK